MDMPSLHNKVARRIAFRGTLPKLLLGFGIMAVLLFVLSSFDFGSSTGQSAGGSGTASSTPTNASTSANSASDGAPVEVSATKRPFPKAGAKKDSAAPSTSPLQALVIAILMLGGLVAVLYFAARFLKKARLIPARRNERLQLEDVLSLGPKKSLHVVRFENRTLVLASAESGVQLIADYAADELTGSALTNAAVETTSVGSIVERASMSVEDAPPAPAAATPAKPQTRVAPRVSNPATASAQLSGAERVPAAFRHLLRREQGLELEA